MKPLMPVGSASRRNRGRVVGAFLVSVSGIVVAGCGDSSSQSGDWGGATPYYGRGPNSACASYSTCGACTPIVGCGWCENANGTSGCTTGPDFCSTGGFTWTWDPGGCRSVADAGVSPVSLPATDAGGFADGTDGDAAASDARQSDGTSEASSDGDAAVLGTGCTSNADNLCTTAAPYGVTCSTADPFDAAIPSPDPSLGCSVVPIPTPVGLAFFCCQQPLVSGIVPR